MTIKRTIKSTTKGFDGSIDGMMGLSSNGDVVFNKVLASDKIFWERHPEKGSRKCKKSIF